MYFRGKKVIQQKALFLIFLSLEESEVGRGGVYDGIKSYFFQMVRIKHLVVNLVFIEIWDQLIDPKYPLLRFGNNFTITNILYSDFGSTIRSQISSIEILVDDKYPLLIFGIKYSITTFRSQISSIEIWEQLFYHKYPLLRFGNNHSIPNILYRDLGTTIRSQISSIEIWEQQFDHKYPLLRFGINYSIPNILYWDLGTTIRSQISSIEIWDQLYDHKYQILRVEPEAN